VEILSDGQIAKLTLSEQQNHILDFWGQFTSVTLPTMIAALQLPGMSTVPETPASVPPSVRVESAIPQIDGERNLS
jgi:hypothetical protein